MKFLPTSDRERQAMPAAIGVSSVDELFAAVPAALRGDPDLPAALSEIEIRRFLGGLAARNSNARETAFFLGGGLYHHHVSAIADQMLYRAEWLICPLPSDRIGCNLVLGSKPRAGKRKSGIGNRMSSRFPASDSRFPGPFEISLLSPAP